MYVFKEIAWNGTVFSTLFYQEVKIQMKATHSEVLLFCNEKQLDQAISYFNLGFKSS